MKLIRLAENYIYDVNHGIGYKLEANSVVVTNSAGTQDFFVGETIGMDALWSWLEEKSSDERYRNLKVLE